MPKQPLRFNIAAMCPLDIDKLQTTRSTNHTFNSQSCATEQPVKLYTNLLLRPPQLEESLRRIEAIRVSTLTSSLNCIYTHIL